MFGNGSIGLLTVTSLVALAFFSCSAPTIPTQTQALPGTAPSTLTSTQRLFPTIQPNTVEIPQYPVGIVDEERFRAEYKHNPEVWRSKYHERRFTYRGTLQGLEERVRVLRSNALDEVYIAKLTLGDLAGSPIHCDTRRAKGGYSVSDTRAKVYRRGDMLVVNGKFSANWWRFFQCEVLEHDPMPAIQSTKPPSVTSPSLPRQARLIGEWRGKPPGNFSRERIVAIVEINDRFYMDQRYNDGKITRSELEEWPWTKEGERRFALADYRYQEDWYVIGSFGDLEYWTSNPYYRKRYTARKTSRRVGQ